MISLPSGATIDLIVLAHCGLKLGGKDGMNLQQQQKDSILFLHNKVRVMLAQLFLTDGQRQVHMNSLVEK